MEIMDQVMIIYAGTYGYLDRYPLSKLEIYERHLHLFLRENTKLSWKTWKAGQLNYRS